MCSLALLARSSQRDRPWPTEDPRVCGIFLYVPRSNQTCVMINHLGRHDRAAKQNAKPAKMITPIQIAKSESGTTIKLRCNTKRTTTNFVYLITCAKCRKRYVGETGYHVNQRMNCHWDDWKQNRFERSPVAEHFCSPEHDFRNHAALCLDQTRRQIEPGKRERIIGSNV